ncbi:MAG: N-acetylmuramoyl-L-alanine amidase, partial [Catalinimonas sp.]
APVDTVRLFTAALSGPLEVHTYHAARTPSTGGGRVVGGSSSDCARPGTVPQSAWRAGLPPPDFTPVFTEVEHLIVHHAASSNALTDYENVVRNIYLFHTQSNGWSDIGYNFVIAQDGTIFEGRDGQGRVDDDNVRGAHFCGKNANTMGVCLLGNLSEVAPTDTALASLAALLRWKADLQGLDPLGSGVHPNGSTTLLANVAGHRDGCATECPGNLMYPRLPEVRTAVATPCDTVPTEPPVPPVPSPVVGVYPTVLTNGEAVRIVVADGAIRRVELFDALSRRVSERRYAGEVEDIRFPLPPVGAGVYLLRLTTTRSEQVVRLLVF